MASEVLEYSAQFVQTTFMMLYDLFLKLLHSYSSYDKKRLRSFSEINFDVAHKLYSLEQHEGNQ